MINKKTIRSPLLFFAILFFTMFVYGCGIIEALVANQNTAGQACTKKGQHQAYCLLEKAIATNDPSFCDKINVGELSNEEKSPELKANIPVIKRKCDYDLSIKTNDPSRCSNLADSTDQYNSDFCYFVIAQKTSDISLCFKITTRGRIDSFGDVLNRAKCISDFKTTQETNPCIEKDAPDMACIVSYSVAMNKNMCAEFYNYTHLKTNFQNCKHLVIKLQDELDRNA